MNISDELVSIVMPSYNTGELIAEAIRSVLNQTYEKWELIIIDDCSTDGTESVVANFDDSRIHYHKTEKNYGTAVCRNQALREAKGKWVAFLDSDDLWLPEKLEKQIKFMIYNGLHFSYTKYEEIDVDGKPKGVTVSGPKKITMTGMYNYCWPGCLTVMYDRNKVGLIQIADIKKNNDYAMWLKICHKEDCYLLDIVLAKYRRGRSGSVSSHSIKTMIVWHYKLFHEAEGQNALIAVVNTCRNLGFGLYKRIKYIDKTY